MAKDTIDDVIDCDETQDVPMLNDAEVRGTITPAMRKLLDTEVTLMGGRLYGMKDRRNTQDGDWKAVKMTWYNWMNGVEGKFGLTRHPVAKSKEGDSLVFAAAMEGARKDSAITTMASIGLDIDSGAALDDVIEKLIELEMFAIVYTSFSHGKDVMELKHDDVMRKLKLDASPNLTQVQEYLRHHHKDRYDPEFIDSIEVLDPRKQTVDGLRIVLKTRPLDKFRVILPLAEPVELSDLAPTLSQWKDVWADAVCGVAVNMLGVNFDATSCDVNRLFFTPRHPKDAEDWYACVIQGDPLGFEEIVPYSKNSYVKNRDDNDPFAAGTEGKGDEVVVYMSPSGKHLNKWHNTHKDRFLLADVIEAFCEDKIRVSGGEKVGTLHCECPFEHEHTASGGTATMVMNPLENELGFWTIFCRHDACNGRNKLEFMQEMLEQGWFEESLLEDDEWNLPDSDDAGEVIEDDAETIAAFLATAESFTKETTTTKEIKTLIKACEKVDIDLVNRANITNLIEVKTVLGKREINALWKEVRTAVRAEKRTEGKVPDIGEWDDSEMVAYAETKVVNAKNTNGDPKIYKRFGDYCVIKNGNIEMLAFLSFKALLDDVSEWSNGKRGVFSPENVAKHIFNRDDKPGAELLGVKTTANFDSNWRRNDTHGYNVATGVYLDSGDLNVPRVSEAPSDDEVCEAKRLFVEEVFSDFPIGGLTREELVKRVMGGEPVPDFANLIGMVLQPFCRDGIDGPTPLYMLTKPTPGTGASLIVDVAATIATGDVAPPQPLPTNAEELEKTMLAIAIGDVEICNFDNLNFTVSGGALASNLTARKVRGRLLSTSRIVVAPVRNLWVGTANNVEASPEILRRIVMIELDAHMARPETRSGWRHDDIMSWVKDNRGRLVWAALTLIQNWVAKGRPTNGVPVANSYENWSRAIGGILKSAGVNGFLGNQERKLSYATTGADNNVQNLMQYLWNNYKNGQVFRAGGTAEVRGYENQTVESLKDVLNLCGEEGKALLIDGYGYSKDADGYVSSNGIAKMFRKSARAPWEVEGGEMTFEECPDPKSPSQVFWIMRKREY